MYLNLAIGFFFSLFIDIKMEEINEKLKMSGISEMTIDELVSLPEKNIN